MAKPKLQQFVLTAPVWRAGEKIPAGTVVEFVDEPTGVYKGRCKPFNGEAVQAAPKGPTQAEHDEALAKLAGVEGERDAALAKLAELEKAAPPPPPASK